MFGILKTDLMGLLVNAVSPLFVVGETVFLLRKGSDELLALIEWIK